MLVYLLRLRSIENNRTNIVVGIFSTREIATEHGERMVKQISYSEFRPYVDSWQVDLPYIS
jgi:hypothetical protein